MHCLARLGDWDAVESRARSVLKRLRFAEDWSDGISIALGLVTVRRRKLHEARTFLSRGFEIAQVPSYSHVRGCISAALVELRAAERDWDGVRAVIEREFEFCTPAMVGRLGEPLASALGWLDPAIADHAPLVLGWAQRYEEHEATAIGDPGHRERARWTAMIRAETLRWRADRDPDPWTDLAAMWEAESRPYETAYCSMRVAEALLLQGGQRAGERVARAATYLRAAHVIATRLGALTLGDSIRELARAGRVPLEVSQRARQAEPTPPNPYGLSERELDVLRLVADGYSNGEIGRALVISTKIASVHVSNILRKLNVANRVEAAVMAGRMGLAGR
jgi:DNA-binding CsgD family transcriptional regulator